MNPSAVAEPSVSKQEIHRAILLRAHSWQAHCCPWLCSLYMNTGDNRPLNSEFPKWFWRRISAEHWHLLSNIFRDYTKLMQGMTNHNGYPCVYESVPLDLCWLFTYPLKKLGDALDSSWERWCRISKHAVPPSTLQSYNFHGYGKGTWGVFWVIQSSN